MKAGAISVLGFHHLAIQVSDLAGCVKFYRDLLGLREQVVHRREDGSVRSVWLALPTEGFLAIELAEGAPTDEPFRVERTGLHLLSLRIRREDVASIEAQLAAAKVPIVHRSRWTLYIRDPEGNRIGLSHHPHDRM